MTRDPAPMDWPDPNGAYWGLADELAGASGCESLPYVEDEWDPAWVAAAKRYAAEQGLPFPPRPAASGWIATIYTTKGPDR